MTMIIYFDENIILSELLEIDVYNLICEVHSNFKIYSSTRFESKSFCNSYFMEFLEMYLTLSTKL